MSSTTLNVVSANTAAETLSVDGAFIQQALANYRKELLSPRLTPSVTLRAANLLRSATERLLANPNEETFGLFLTFHKDNVDGVCQERNALAGVDRLPKTVSIPISTVYVCFRYLTTGIGDLPDMKKVLTIVKNNKFCILVERTNPVKKK